MWPDRVSNPGPLTYESGALPTTLRGPAKRVEACFATSLFTFTNYEVFLESATFWHDMLEIVSLMEMVYESTQKFRFFV